MVLLEATVPTGLEWVAKDEASEKLSVSVKEYRGRIHFDFPDIQKVGQVLDLRSIDNLYVIVLHKEVKFPEEKDEALLEVRKLVQEVDWEPGLQTWQSVFGKSSVLSIADAVHSSAVYRDEKKQSDVWPIEELQIPSGSDGLPKFRVTCVRTGKGHSFGSPEAAAILGYEIQKCFGWPVSMKQFDIEVYLHIQENQVNLGISLTKESLHKRNIATFGPTTLRATICYSLVRMTNPGPGEVVCDPLCGGGSIPIEAALEWPQSVVLAGDSHDKAVQRSLQNISHIYQSRTSPSAPLIVIQWDATSLPLRTSSVDCIVTDLPFGKRLGSKYENKKLYPNLLREWARVTKVGSGRAVVLSQDRKNLRNSIVNSTNWWKQVRYSQINVGGLEAAICLLRRTSREFSDHW